MPQRSICLSARWELYSREGGAVARKKRPVRKPPDAGVSAPPGEPATESGHGAPLSASRGQPRSLPVDISAEERRILEALSSTPVHIDDLARSLNIQVALLSSRLIVLEMRGLARRSPGMYYSLSRDHAS